jgi:hypothetical protein
VYYPRNCPHHQHSKSCAKPVPSFIFAGSEFAGASYVFRMLKEHPQVAAASVDNSHPNHTTHVFDSEDYDEADAFDSYIAQFPFLKDDVLATMEEKKNWIVGENAPHYLYQSHLTAKRIKDNLPHVKVRIDIECIFCYGDTSNHLACLFPKGSDHKSVFSISK